MTRKIIERGWSFINEDGHVDTDFFEKTKPIPAWDFLKAIRVTRTVTYEVRAKKLGRRAR